MPGVIDQDPYLKELGITMVELLPVHQFDPQEGNYWGYMTLNFFAPHGRYAADRGTCPRRVPRDGPCPARGGHRGHPRRRLQPHGRGRPGRADLQLQGDRQRRVLPDVRRPAERSTAITPDAATRSLAPASASWTLILDSLRYWVTEMHVDGFRFDLASVLARGPDGTLRDGRHLAPGRDPHRPDPATRPPDRRALGCRLGLPARHPVPRAGVVPVERPVPRRRPPIRPRRSRHGRGADAPALRQRRPVPR